MIWQNLIWTLIFLSLNGLGIMGNILILVRHVYTFVTGTEKKPIDLILIHLAFSNMTIIFSIEIKDTATAFYFRSFLSDVGCKIVVYLGRMARGLSICTTSLLSMVQAVTINPRMTLWRKLKPQTTWHVLLYLLLFWLFNSLISSNMLCYVTAVSTVNRSGVGMYGGYCYMQPSRLIVRWLFLSLMALRDVIFQSLMGWSSASMALHLYKHHKQVSYLHSSKCVNNSSPEIRATQSTLILMTCFLFFYWVDFIFSFYIGFIVAHGSIISITKSFLELGYAVLSPFVLISRDVHVAKYCSVHQVQKSCSKFISP
uniref:putative vomeronasal receptor-like protein 4 n=1 Tax=Jaculus jaculus TaxID=51337 RepID=UPI001E1B5B90|nr:putative vomeronasal receptor-like protein 4 [Jaculus jaculus]